MDFSYQEFARDWSWQSEGIAYTHLPRNALATQNMSTVLMAISLSQSQLPVDRAAIDRGLANVNLPGRIQIVPGVVTEIYDVSHNPAAVTWLADRLRAMPCNGKTHAVFSMLADKDIVQSVNAIKDMIDDWYIAPLATKRGASEDVLRHVFKQAEISNVELFASISEAYKMAQNKSEPGDRIVVFGSFHTVAEIFK